MEKDTENFSRWATDLNMLLFSEKKCKSSRGHTISHIVEV